MSETEPDADSSLTLGVLIERVAERFESAGLYFGHGTDNAWDEAVALVLAVTGAADDRGSLSISVAPSQHRRVDELAARRVDERMPLPYLLGWARFCGLEFLVEPGVLIPRSPIAELISDGFAPWLSKPPKRVLDLACGGGCIGLAIAHHCPGSQVVCSDISAPALDLARRNTHALGLADRVAVVESDVFERLDGRFDLIVSNPPYVDADEMQRRPPEYRHEPELALASGDDGLDFTRRLLAEAADFLTDNGLLVVEVGASAPALERAYPTVPFTWLEFERGGEGVFLLEAAQLASHTAALSR